MCGREVLLFEMITVIYFSYHYVASEKLSEWWWSIWTMILSFAIFSTKSHYIVHGVSVPIDSSTVYISTTKFH